MTQVLDVSLLRQLHISRLYQQIHSRDSEIYSVYRRSMVRYWVTVNLS